MRISPRTRIVAAFAFVLPLLVGCTSQAESVTPTWTTPTPAGEKVAVSYPMPDLGPSPTPTPLTDVDRETLRLEYQDRDWSAVLASYPDAVRPEVTFKGYLDGDAYTARLTECFGSAGITIDRGRDEDGNQSGISWSIANMNQAISAFICQSEQPSSPMSQPNDEMLGYIYDYLTEFLVPCYAANGGENPPAPTRDEFIANWPNQNWFPVGPWDENWAEGHSIDDACPSQP